MSDKFDDRVNAAANTLMDDRFKALQKLDPVIARRYAIGVDHKNAQHLRDGTHLTGFGKFSKDDVDDVLEAALDDQGTPRITKQEEEALLIILASPIQWEDGAKDYMIEQLEEDLKYVWSSKPIDDAAQLLHYTYKLDFVSRGDKHAGTGLHYTPQDYQIIAGLIAQGGIGAYEVSDRRTYTRTLAGRAHAWGFYEYVKNDIYLIKGLNSRDRLASFCHEATHAIQDLKNIPHSASLAKYVEADGYITQAFVSLRFGMPYAAYPDRPEEVAYRGAANLLWTPPRSRNKAWERDFKKAYDDVVDAYIALKGTADADQLIDMLEGAREQKREKALWEKMRDVLKKKK